MSMSDPCPELRCRCVSRKQLPKVIFQINNGGTTITDRCSTRATQEDGLCDVCRHTEETHPMCEFIHYRLDDPRTECFDYERY